LLAALAAAACGSRDEATATRPALLPVTLPDLARVDAPVQAQARAKHAALTEKINAHAPDAELGAAYGDLGILLQAAEFRDPAEAAYLNARRLMPADPRWPYYLAHVYRAKGDVAKAIESLQRVLERLPQDVPALVWLGRMYMDQGQAEDAEPLFAQAQSVAPRTVAVLAGLGQVALARRDYAKAAMLLEQALALDRSAASIHSPLALAYRGLGETAKAEAHLKEWRNTEVALPDPLMEQLTLALESGLSYELQGVRALAAGDFPSAAASFRRGVALASGDTFLGRSLRHKLGTALYLGGDVAAAVEQFDATTRLAPAGGLDEPTAKAYYSLGVIAVASNRPRDAVERVRAALKYSPTYIEARLALADALRRTGRFDEALTNYRELPRLNPRAAEARFGYAMALVKLGRYVDARTWLDEAVRVQPDRPELAHALARVLAAAPEPQARDGQRAMTIVQELLKTNKTTPVGETMAMALAEIGDYRQAVAVQGGVIDAATRAGLRDVVRRMEANLRLYERDRPCRTPWADDDPVHQPGAPVSP
jgi:tetratricopeptide (TPR) repeat protein